MKSERRHELETNQLALMLERSIERVKPHANAIIWGVVGVAALVVVIALWRNYSRSQDVKASNEFFAATNRSRVDLDERVDVVEQYGGSEIGQWAQLRAAHEAMRLGREALAIDRTEANNFFNIARDNYKDVLAEASNETFRNIAQYNLAKAYEWTGDAKAARQHYEKVGGSLADAAKEAADRLDGKMLAWYDWFKEAEAPAPALGRQQGLPGILGERPQTDVADPDFLQKQFGDIGSGPLTEPAEDRDVAPSEDAPQEGDAPTEDGPSTTAPLPGLPPLDPLGTGDGGTATPPASEPAAPETENSATPSP